MTRVKRTFSMIGYTGLPGWRLTETVVCGVCVFVILKIIPVSRIIYDMFASYVACREPLGEPKEVDGDAS